eukprot:TRINITY_DN3361_c0_g1_i1.p1 TRINITY_DN3361_c0_g1~~TRINITY_DN3361_c0_g1_i1.p1  ORF type:complete len:1080 (-),score=222.09 TRINITY_DN3361_c0_g1_i1:133-3372(-)
MAVLSQVFISIIWLCATLAKAVTVTLHDQQPHTEYDSVFKTEELAALILDSKGEALLNTPAGAKLMRREDDKAEEMLAKPHMFMEQQAPSSLAKDEQAALQGMKIVVAVNMPFYRFVVTGARSMSVNRATISEFGMLNEYGELIDLANSSVVEDISIVPKSGSTFSGNEDLAWNLIDGDTRTSADISFGDELLIRMRHDVHVSGWGFKTSQLSTEYDPEGFIFEGSLDGKEWLMLGDKSRYNATSTVRGYLTGPFIVSKEKVHDAVPQLDPAKVPRRTKTTSTTASTTTTSTTTTTPITAETSAEPGTESRSMAPSREVSKQNDKITTGADAGSVDGDHNDGGGSDNRTTVHNFEEQLASIARESGLALEQLDALLDAVQNLSWKDQQAILGAWTAVSQIGKVSSLVQDTDALAAKVSADVNIAVNAAADLGMSQEEQRDIAAKVRASAQKRLAKVQNASIVNGFALSEPIGDVVKAASEDGLSVAQQGDIVAEAFEFPQTFQRMMAEVLRVSLPSGAVNKSRGLLALGSQKAAEAAAHAGLTQEKQETIADAVAKLSEQEQEAVVDVLDAARLGLNKSVVRRRGAGTQLKSILKSCNETGWAPARCAAVISVASQLSLENQLLFASLWRSVASTPPQTSTSTAMASGEPSPTAISTPENAEAKPSSSANNSSTTEQPPGTTTDSESDSDFEGEILTGWCSNFSEGSSLGLGEGKSSWEGESEARCFQRCRFDAMCEQAIHEISEVSGHACWLGVNIMMSFPIPSRKHSGARCFAKQRFLTTTTTTESKTTESPEVAEAPSASGGTTIDEETKRAATITGVTENVTTAIGGETSEPANFTIAPAEPTLASPPMANFTFAVVPEFPSTYARRLYKELHNGEEAWGFHFKVSLAVPRLLDFIARRTGNVLDPANLTLAVSRFQFTWPSADCSELESGFTDFESINYITGTYANERGTCGDLVATSVDSEGLVRFPESGNLDLMWLAGEFGTKYSYNTGGDTLSLQIDELVIVERRGQEMNEFSICGGWDRSSYVGCPKQNPLQITYPRDSVGSAVRLCSGHAPHFDQAADPNNCFTTDGRM